MENVIDMRPMGGNAWGTTSGSTDMRVSNEWVCRGADERFTSLSSLYEYTKARAVDSRTAINGLSDVKVIAQEGDDLKIQLPGAEHASAMSNWSFGQVSRLAAAPAGYLNRLPAQIAGINLQYGLSQTSEQAGFYTNADQSELRAATGPTYGRIFDYQIVGAVQRIAGEGTGDAPWKIPGAFNNQGIYDPNQPITAESTTLYASDRDVFMFLIDDAHPIEIGKDARGNPDILYRGFYTWNSEVGNATLGIATFYLRGVCQNRILWGVEGFNQIKIKHSKGAPHRFTSEVAPVLQDFSHAPTMAVQAGVTEAKSRIVARDDDERETFLRKRGFSKSQTQAVIASVLREEQTKPESIWDFVQGITAVARAEPHQDKRIALEQAGGKILSLAA